MHLLKTTLLAALAIGFAACQKNDRDIQKSEEDCFVGSTAVAGQPVPGQYIVTYKEGTNTDEAAQHRLAEMTRRMLKRHNIGQSSIRQSFAGRLAGFVARMNEAEAQKLKSDPEIALVEQDRVIALSTCFTVVNPTLVTWNVKKVGYGNGAGKTAWVIDTGIDMDHPDLNVDQNKSRSFISSSSSPEDEHGHGTHVAGVIGALNNNIGMLGVASGANLVALKVLDKDGKGTTSGVIQALAYVNTYGKAGDVVNLSLGEEVVSTTLDQQVKHTASKGIYIAIAAGNEGKAANLYSPGRANGDNIFTVSAVDSLDRFASFSNFGSDVVDYAAPGVHIKSTYKNGMYAMMSGTSMAAPHVAGLLLLNGRNLHSSTTALNDPDGVPDRIAMK